MVSSLALYGFVLLFTYVAGLSLYRLVFSPLAEFPGPKLAGLTLWYEFYYDVIKRGQYLFKIRDMHERYGKLLPWREAGLPSSSICPHVGEGPIVRISPFELHVNDPEFLPILY